METMLIGMLVVGVVVVAAKSIVPEPSPRAFYDYDPYVRSTSLGCMPTLMAGVLALILLAVALF
jgi:hypothetical protein